MTKLPDPKINGNAGSFFKNPIVSAQVAKRCWRSSLMHRTIRRQMAVKLAAGWLIDQCQLKGQRIGGAAVHRQQALVLINEDRATSEDVVKLAHYVRQQVGAKFDVWLQPEVRFIGTHGEVNAEESIA
jgi:UDP-N-acetylmuramate dehydrogenase